MRCCTILVLILCTGSVAFSGEGPSNLDMEMGYDEVIRDLVAKLGRDPVTAQDAAVKLSRLGKRVIPVVSEVFAANFVPDPAKKPVAGRNPQVAYFCALTLARIKSAEAARPLLPLLSADKADPALRGVAMEALGLEFVPEAGPLLQKMAAGDPSIEMRRKAYGQLSITPTLWVASEKLFLDALSDPDDEIRILASKQCMYARVYRTAIPKMIELAEKDPHSTVRLNCVLALSRMMEKRAVPAFVRICLDKEATAQLHTASLQAINFITREGLKDINAVEPWWKRSGEKEYAKLELRDLEKKDGEQQKEGETGRKGEGEKQKDTETRGRGDAEKKK
ncbi:MAG TPA: HEAT repeat domain-containing protein [Planctomycetota bacterium]|jgi:hypothetical protein